MNKDQNQFDKGNTGIYILGSIGVVIIIGLWLIAYYQLKDLPESDRGTFGDMFGSINALFSGLALAGIIFTILLQRKELEYQREELRETRKEFQIQNKTLKLQRFESTFFNLLSLHQQIVESMDLFFYKNKEERKFFNVQWKRSGDVEELERVEIKGRDVFKHRYDSLVELFAKNIDTNLEQIEAIYLSFYKTTQSDFAHYFRNLYRIIKLVDEFDFSFDQAALSPSDDFKKKYQYTSIARAQLSDYELLWIFYNCLSKNGIEKFKPLIEKYSLFKNMPIEMVINSDHLKYYAQSAFKPQSQ